MTFLLIVLSQNPAGRVNGLDLSQRSDKILSMQSRTLWKLTLIVAIVWMVVQARGADFQFRHHFIDRTLPVTDKLVGDYGLTALVDLDRDGDLDFILGGRPSNPSQLYWFEYQAPDRWTRHLVGTNYLSDVGLAALDVDGDGWTDLVCSGVWFLNPGKPRELPFERIMFDEKAAGAHDILVADIDGDGKPDVVMMGDERTKLNSLCWYSIPPDPRQPWVRHFIGPSVHGAITPGGVADLDGDGDLDIIRADTWFENKDSKGREWVAHKNIPMGRKGPFGVCVRTAVADLDGDGKPEIIIADSDIEDSKVAVLKNADGKGGQWNKMELPQSFTYGSLHALAVADFNGDGRPDILVNEQEELLPSGRENPRWIIWENLGGNRFAEHIILDSKLGGHELQVGDVDGDGDIDICSKAWGPRPWNGNGGKMHVDFLENLWRGRK
jgi:FG-GAP-like repeat